MRVTLIFGPWEQDTQERREGGGKRLTSTALLDSDLNSDSATY